MATSLALPGVFPKRVMRRAGALQLAGPPTARTSPAPWEAETAALLPALCCSLPHSLPALTVLCCMVAAGEKALSGESFTNMLSVCEKTQKNSIIFTGGLLPYLHLHLHPTVLGE